MSKIDLKFADFGLRLLIKHHKTAVKIGNVFDKNT